MHACSSKFHQCCVQPLKQTVPIESGPSVAAGTVTGFRLGTKVERAFDHGMTKVDDVRAIDPVRTRMYADPLGAKRTANVHPLASYAAVHLEPIGKKAAFDFEALQRHCWC